MGLAGVGLGDAAVGNSGAAAVAVGVAAAPGARSGISGAAAAGDFAVSPAFGFAFWASMGIGGSTSPKFVATSSARSACRKGQGARTRRLARRAVRMRMEAPH